MAKFDASAGILFIAVVDSAASAHFHQLGALLMRYIRQCHIYHILLSCLAYVPGQSLAQSETAGFYTSAYAQATHLGSTTFDEIGNAGLGSGLRTDFDGGVGFGGDIGYRYGNGWAAEFEWNWRRHDLKSLQGGGTAVTDGDFASNIFFVNGLRRFVGEKGGWIPYTGVGIGWVQEIDFDLNSGATERAWSKQGKVAFQLIGGVEIPLNNLWSVVADARIMRVGRVELPAEEGVTGRLSSPSYNPISVQLGLRRMF
jgi:outer membrane protein